MPCWKRNEPHTKAYATPTDARQSPYWLALWHALVGCLLYAIIHITSSAQTPQNLNPANTASQDTPGVTVQNVSIVTTDPDKSEKPGYALNADIEIKLTNRLEEALTRGVPLTFVIEFELHRPRWYWWDAEIVRETQTWRLSYQTITRQYRLALGTLQFRFNSLNDALRTLGRIRQWQVIEKSNVKLNENYQAQLRLRLDTSLLPKPFQVNAITNSDWTLATDWKRFIFQANSIASNTTAVVQANSGLENKEPKNNENKP